MLATTAAAAYPSDLSDEEWALIEPVIPPAKRGGGKRTVDVREVVNGLMYVLSTGCQWRAIPKDLPPRSTVMAISPAGTTTARWIGMHHALYVNCREQATCRPARPLRSLIAKASRARKKGALDRSAGL